MFTSVLVALVVVTFIVAIVAAAGKCPVTVPVILLAIIELIKILPIK